ncbi:MAG: tetratricopeptide repeat protein [Prevotella sp.]|nr:tetratricopeptide repeat protein [Prevotella sp.]
MKKIILLAIVATITTIASAQPSAVQKVGRSVFSLTTFRADGSLLASTHGLYVGTNGEAVSSWKPFVGAARATVVDAEGQEHEVEAIYGANELYDVCRFRVEGTSQAAPLAKSNATSGQKTWLLGYSVKKSPAKQYAVESVETFGDKGYGYYIFKGKAAENMADCPFVNQNGEVIGLCELPKSEEVHATDVRFINSFTTNGLSINDNLLTQTSIRVAMPLDLNDARLTLMMAGEKHDSAAYVGYIRDFIRQFPQEIDGYSSRGQLQLYAHDLAGADATMQEAIANVAHKDEAHSAFASLMMQQQFYLPDSTFTAWSLQRALDEANTANSINPQPIYQHQQAQLIYALGDYQKAYDQFIALTKSPIRNGELFYEAAQCRTHLGGTTDEVIELLDSAIAVNPDNNISAPYYLARGRMLDQATQYRKAIQDYNKYDTLMLGRGSHEFYYIKFKAEVQVRQYQQALNDIAHAIILNRQEPTYYAEMGSLQLRVRQFEDAIKTSDMCIQLDSEYSDPYIIKGVAHGELGQRAEALQAFEKAKELGDDRADGMIEKYKK